MSASGRQVPVASRQCAIPEIAMRRTTVDRRVRSIADCSILGFATDLETIFCQAYRERREAMQKARPNLQRNA